MSTQAIGRRKTSVARVRIQPGSGRIIVNKKEYSEYFSGFGPKHAVLAGLEATGQKEALDVFVRVKGGGVSGQAVAVRHGLARALQTHNPEHRSVLKKHGYLRRDPRMVERKKYGLHKARRGTQFSKR